MSTTSLQSLRTTSWLADRLGLSVATVERLRTQRSMELPPHITIGRSVRYDEVVVEEWLSGRMRLTAQKTGNELELAAGSKHD